MKLTLNFVICTCLCALVAYGQPAPCGVGALVLVTHAPIGERLQIMGVASNSPAARAGLAAGQVIRAIDGVPTKGMELADCVRRIQGEAGTKVVLEVEDWRRGWTNAVELTRSIVPDDPLARDARGYEIRDAEKRKAVSVTTNQVVMVVGPEGAITLIQFTRFGTTNANYRWRSRTVPGGSVTSGTGVVFEDYESRVDAYGGHRLTHRGSWDDLFVKAGSVRLQWSSSSLTNGWLYYYPSLGKLEILASTAFDSSADALGSPQRSLLPFGAFQTPHAMNGSAITAVFVVLLLLAVYSWERKRRRSALMRWAASEGYRVVRSRQPLLSEMRPFPVTVSKAQQIFQITVDCGDGTRRSGWILLGNGLNGPHSNAAKIQWDA